MTTSSTNYTIEQLCGEDFERGDVLQFFKEEAPKIAELFDNKFDFKNTPLVALAERGKFLICRRNGEIRGYLICYTFHSPLDPKVKILYQLSFYVKPDSGRTAYHLFQRFIDIGKSEANHVITMLTSHSNIKPQTLEKYGFKELETLYRLEIT